ncbi:MAG: hypothetical protein WC141_00040 [Arcobacteraceae bacterium]
MNESNVSVVINISSILDLLQNNIIISFIGIGGVLLGLVKLTKVILEHLREKDKQAKEQRQSEYKNLKEVLLKFNNKEVSSINTILFNKNLTFDQMMKVSEEIHKLYTKDNNLFISQLSLFKSKILNNVKEKNIAYRQHISLNNVPANKIDTNINKDNIKSVLKLHIELNHEIDKLPLYIKTQFHLYLEFNKILVQELTNIQTKFARKLGL